MTGKLIDRTATRVHRSLWLVGLLAAATLFPAPAISQVPAETEARLRSIFEARDFDARSFQATWLPDGSAYTTLETPSGALQPELIRYDAASGNRTVLASLSHLTPAGRSEPLSISSYQFAPDGTWALLGTDTDGFWMLEPATSTLKRVEAGPGSTVSPEGGRILFSRDGDLHVHDLAAAQTSMDAPRNARLVRRNGGGVWVMVLSSIRPVGAARGEPLARMEMRGSGPNRHGRLEAFVCALVFPTPSH